MNDFSNAVAHESDAPSEAQSAPSAASRTPMEITKFTKPVSDGPLSKTIRLGPDGKPHPDARDCWMRDGEAKPIEFNEPFEFAEAIASCSSQNAFTLGSIRAEFRPANGGAVPVVLKRALAQARGSLARTRDCLEFRSGAPAPMLLDHDRKGMPDDVRDKLGGAGGLWAAISSVCPGLKGAARVERPSTSSGLCDTRDGRKFSDGDGRHVYLFAPDGADIPRATEALHERLTLAGYGWAWVTKGGAVVDRSIVDASVATPEHWAFEGDPKIEPPLAQDKASRSPVVVTGDLVDTRSAIPDLDPAERAKLAIRRASARKQVEAQAKDVQKRCAEARAKIYRDKTSSTCSLDMLRERFMQAYDGRLAPEHELVFDDPALGVQTVAGVLMDPARFIDATLSDPLEGPSYGPCKAKVLKRDDGRLFVNSFAHGGMTYRLLLDRAALEAMIRQAAPGEAANILGEWIDDALLFPGGEDDLVTAVVKRDGTGKREVQNRIKEWRSRRRREARSAREAKTPPDPRLTIAAPTGDGELDVFCMGLDAMLADVNGPEPPMRGINGKLATAIEKPIDNLHLLTSASANATAGANTPAAAPPEVRLAELDNPISIAMEIERWARFERKRKNGENAFVRLPADFCLGFNNLRQSRLPMAQGVQTLPLVVPRNGSLVVLAENGLDRGLGLVFRVDPAIRAAIPNPARVTLADALAAWRYLSDDWLADVNTDKHGKAILIALACSIIGRLLLDVRPVFFVTAPVASAGKTTAAHMVSAATTGRSAAAAQWSMSEEERRKTIFATLTAGAAFVVFDNIPRGAAISCPTIERASTSWRISDRVLGSSRQEEAPATTIMALTGNAIGPAKDLASRSLCVEIAADRPDPENRAFKHPDPIGWTLAHRTEILTALYMVMLAPHGTPTVPMTRFKLWQTLIGNPIEAVSGGVNFNDLIGAYRALDPETIDAEKALTILHNKFGKRKFLAADVAALFAPTPSVFPAPAETPARAAARQEAEALREALNGAVPGAPLPIDPTTRQVGLRLHALANRPIDAKGWLLFVRERQVNQGNYYWIEVCI